MSELIVDESVDAAWTRLTSDGSAITWIACGYTDSKVGTLTLKAEGTGGLPEFKEQLPEDDVVWGAFKVMGVDDRGTTVSRRPKFIFVKYIPSGVASMKRAKTGGHKGTIKRTMNCAIDIEADTKEQISEEDIISKLRASGGAHQPTRYEFTDFSG